MSDMGRSHVLKNSPYTGSTFFVHYFLGDLANPDHDYKLWLSMTRLAERLRMNERTVRRAVAELVNDGHLILVEERPGFPNVYQLAVATIFDALPQTVDE